MKWRSGMVLAVWTLGSLLPGRTLLAQQAPAQGAVRGPMAAPAVDPACACYVEEEPGEEPGPDGPGGTGNRKWLILGAAGLAVLSGVPFGGTTVQGLPFAAAPVAPDMPAPAVEIAQAPEVPAVQAPAPAAAPAPVTLAPAPAAEIVALPEVERAGIVPPKTATHLPLLAAAGVLMLGGGTVLARRSAREQRRRRRFVTL